ncbi:unnamed protein product [Pleuronectes platessa]|uniref:Uncharacterized protein n=1 Tax=Pleuronectes platessa TaxID=8262 RepID=A0A9N7U2V3_PLEPL|nr:unnamed protein product [Pleuronectes platessa]
MHREEGKDGEKVGKEKKCITLHANVDLSVFLVFKVPKEPQCRDEREEQLTDLQIRGITGITPFSLSRFEISTKLPVGVTQPWMRAVIFNQCAAAHWCGRRAVGGDPVRRSAAATLDACRDLLADHLSYGARWGNPPFARGPLPAVRLGWRLAARTGADQGNPTV